jgi:hypothetical protein
MSSTLMSRKHLCNNNLKDQHLLKELILFFGYVYICIQLFYFTEMYKGMLSDEKYHI